MKQTSSTQSEIDALNKEYDAYINELRTNWLVLNRVNSNDVYEVMSSREREDVRSRMAEWGRYVTPLAEAWWKKKGFGVIWPASDSESMKIHKL